MKTRIILEKKHFGRVGELNVGNHRQYHLVKKKQKKKGPFYSFPYFHIYLPIFFFSPYYLVTSMCNGVSETCMYDTRSFGVTWDLRKGATIYLAFQSLSSEFGSSKSGKAGFPLRLHIDSYDRNVFNTNSNLASYLLPSNEFISTKWTNLTVEPVSSAFCVMKIYKKVCSMVYIHICLRYIHILLLYLLISFYSI